MDADDRLQRRLASMEARVTDLEKEVRRLRSLAGLVDISEKKGAEHSSTQTATTHTDEAPAPSPHIPPGVSTPDELAPGEAVPPVMGPRVPDRPPALEHRRRQQSKDPLQSLRAVLRSEDIISKVGIALLLIGLALMFKFGIDRGWITPPVRIGIGFLFGFVLSVGGLRLRTSRKRFSRVLLGGSVATFYVTIFSAYQLYALFSYEIAFVLMVIVTATSFWISVRQDDVVLALIATAGGLGTPFLLYSGAPGILWLIIYTCLVCGSAMGIYVYRGWRWLLVVTAAGALSVLTQVWLQINDVGYVAYPDRIVYQVGVLFCLGLFGFIPSVRERLATTDPERWPRPPTTFRRVLLADRPDLWLCVLSPIAALALSRGVWDVTPVVWGAFEVVFATGYWAVYLFRRNSWDDLVVSGFGLAAGLLLAISWFDLFENRSMTLLALTLEAGAILVATRINEDRPVRILGHALFAFVGMWTATRLLDVPPSPSLIRFDSLAHLMIIVGIGTAAGVSRSENVRSSYRVAATLLMAIAWFSFFAGGSVRFLLLAAQAAVVMVWVQLIEDRWLRYAGHFLFVALAFAMLQRITQMSGGVPPLINGASMADLVVIAIAAGVSFVMPDSKVRMTYRFGAYFSFLLWFWRDLVPLPDGHAYVSIAWGLTAITLIAIGWRTNRDLVRQTGLATLSVVVLKLFLIDLSEIDPVWRIVLFIGFGAVLLLVSYLFPTIWRGERSGSASGIEVPGQDSGSSTTNG